MSALASIEESVSRLSSGRVAALPDALKQRIAAHQDPQKFAKHFVALVEAELSGSYHQFGHGKATKESKAFFHKAEADLASDLLGLVYPPIDFNGAAPGVLGPYNP